MKMKEEKATKIQNSYKISKKIHKKMREKNLRYYDNNICQSQADFLKMKEEKAINLTCRGEERERKVQKIFS